MTELRIENLVMPAASLGPDNPLPPLRPMPPPLPGVAYKVHENVPPEARRHLGYGCDAGLLPYSLQDGYDRLRKPTPLKTAVLENDVLRATFLLDLGGRMWSLFHKPSGRELLYKNPVFQPANLAFRDAWFSGGVEWNAAVPGHSPFTCSPVFAARLRADDGTPVLRLYEWERIRAAPYQLDFSLPEGSPWLFVHVRLINPHATPLPMYWWSNIAVPEAPDARVLAPADGAYTFGLTPVMTRIAMPEYAPGRDASYSTRIHRSADFFFDIPAGQRPWIAALDGSGKGLVQASTHRQRGRKFFAWGVGPGGRRWQEFLSVPGRPYLEIQAGVAQTQMECFPLAAGEEASWVESYGLLETDSAAAHDTSWEQARRAVGAALDQRLPERMLDGMLPAARALAIRPPEQILNHGSGWGALEERRRERAGQTPFHSPGLVFGDASLTDAQAPWLALLETGTFPEANTTRTPGPWLTQPEWRSILEQAVLSPASDHWFAWVHLGVMRYAARDAKGARQAWQRSLSRRPSGWALRNLACLAALDKRSDASCDLYMAAREQLPELLPLAIECATALIGAGRFADARRSIETLPEPLRRHGRIEVLFAQACLEMDDLAPVEAVLNSGVEVPDIREGNEVLSDLWFRLQEKKTAIREKTEVTPELRERVRRLCPPPAQIDFRMTVS